jgi:hypothetical protein
MSAVISPRTAPLAPANGYGVGGGCRTTRNSNGDAVFESSNYEITVTGNSVVTIHNKNTGETYQVSGDPHVSIDGVQAFDFHETMTFMLNDGTKVTIDTMPWGTGGATVASRVTITNADAHYGVQINGVSPTDNQDISFSETLQYGSQLDVDTADNMMIFENASGAGFLRFDPKTGRNVVVDQAGVNADEAAAPGGMFDPNATAPYLPTQPKGSSMNSTTIAPASFSTPEGFASYLRTNGAGNLDISTIFSADSFKNGAYTYKLSNGSTVSFTQNGGAGEPIQMTITLPAGQQLHAEFGSVNGGQFQMIGHSYVSNTGNPAIEKLINQNMTGSGSAGMLSALQLTDGINDPSKKKKKGDGTDGAEGGSENWFIALAEGLGEILNKLAIELKDAVDSVTLDDQGQPPYKDGMRIQGLAQQLQFLCQAFMTILNTVGEATKTVVTAGGAAR